MACVYLFLPSPAQHSKIIRLRGDPGLRPSSAVAAFTLSHCAAHLQRGGSQMGVILPPQRTAAMSEDVLG